MTRRSSLQPEFVEFIPDKLVTGILYVSIPYATAVHLCCCGCGNEVVTPITPTDWSLMFDGESVSLDPSIGNWNFDCQSHYWIMRNEVHWAPRWSRDQIETGRERDRRRKAAHFGAQEPMAREPVATKVPSGARARQLLMRLIHRRRF